MGLDKLDQRLVELDEATRPRARVMGLDKPDRSNPFDRPNPLDTLCRQCLCPHTHLGWSQRRTTATVAKRVTMQLISFILAALAALLHVYIFVMESLHWERPETRKVFGTTPEQAATTKQLAYNQGCYNLFLAITVAAGVVLAGSPVVSTTLLVVGLGSMLAAALVLVTNDRSKARAALVQGLLPALGLLFLAVSQLV